MKNFFLILLLFITAISFSQRDMTPGSRKQAFGKRDFRNLSNTGLQFQLGPTYLMTRTKNPSVLFDNGVTNGRYTIDPKGLLGFYGEIGLTHFPKKRSKLSLALKTVLVSYYDWGIGFKHFRGQENLTLERLSPSGAVLGTAKYQGNFNSGFIYARFSLHKNVHFKALKNFFLDNSLGFNLDYNVLVPKVDFATSQYQATLNIVGAPQHYHTPFVAQLHYGLGFGFRLKRGAYLIPGVRVPILGINEWHKGNPSLKWFTRSYWPILFHVKYMFLFEKKSKPGSCTGAATNDQDKNTNRNR